MTTGERSKALVRRYFEEIEAGNLDVIDELFAEDFTTGTDVVRSDIEPVGRESLKLAWREFRSAFPDIQSESQELIAEGNTVAYIQMWTGHHEGEFRGIEPTGNEVTHEMWGRYVVEDGQIVHGDAQVDNFGRFKQLGLELSIEGYRTLIDTAPDPIIIADIDTGAVIETNEAAEKLLERPREAIIGRDQHALHSDDGPYEQLFVDAAARAHDAPVELASLPDGSDVELLRADGSRVPVEINAQVVRLAEVTTLVSIYRDVSGRRRRKQRLQVLNRVLRHNLRNDLGAVEGLASTLARDLDGENARRAERIAGIANELVGLGQKVRNGERIRAAETTLPKSVSIPDVVADALANHPEAETSVDGPAEATVRTVRPALTLAVENLVENAVEHTESATPAVRVAVDPTDDGVEVSVADDGPGIPDHELAVLEEGQETPLEHSSGIGLWLVHWAVDAVRGEIDFETGPEGTRVTVHVPSLE
jgi:PAS domain S-box-containing protein